MPWWGAILIAAAATFTGFAIDAAFGNQELTGVFATLYVIGCLAAVLAVQRSGIFTAVVQPPLILFIAVPAAYFLFHRSEINGLRDVLINCGYPLVERFLLMFTTSVVVLLIGMARWYFGAADRVGSATRKAAVGAGVVGGVGAKLAAMFSGRSADDSGDDEVEPQPRARRPQKPPVERATARSPRERRPSRQRATPSRSRPPMDDPDTLPPAARRRYADSGRDVDDALGPPPPRRRRTPRDPGSRGAPPRAYRSRDFESPDPPERRMRPSRYQSAYEPFERYGPADAAEPYEAPPSPPETHHPISNVRYRGGGDDDGDKRDRRHPRG